MRIVVDAMGGDHAPGEVVKGAVEAAQEYQVEVKLVGQEDLIRRELVKYGLGEPQIQIVNATEVISFDESPVTALKRKKDSSLVKGLQLVRDGVGDAFVSAGSTGALMAGGLLMLGRIPGVKRPALGSVLPTVTGSGVLILDVGANLQADADNLFQFAVMGSIYAENILGLRNPRVGLLNVGTEEIKGPEAIRSAHEMLSRSQLNFTGNVEARDIPYGVADVVVCNGFVGNVILKYSEGLASGLVSIIKKSFTSSLRATVGALLLRPAFAELGRKLDYAEYGGAPFLGLEALCIKCHGSSNSKAIKNGIRVAKEFVANEVIKRIRNSIKVEDGQQQ